MPRRRRHPAGLDIAAYSAYTGCRSDNVATMVDTAAHETMPGRLWRAVTDIRLLIASAVVSLVAGTVGGIGWVLLLRETWGPCPGTVGFGAVEQHVISALLLVAGVVVAVSVFRMSRDTTRIGRVQGVLLA